MARLQSLSINDTGNLTIPSGTTAQRPTVVPTVQSFTTVGTTSWTAPTGVTQIEVLVVAGGGGGGYEMGGGGGGGGVIYNSAYPVTPGTQYTVTVGTGGTGRTSNGDNGGNGGNSVFAALTAIGGGAGGNNSVPFNGANTGGSPRQGGSGGGSGENSAGGVFVLGSAPGTPGQGFAGGGAIELGPLGFRYQSGGGGGAGGPGITAVADGFGNGGPGFFSSIGGTPTYYAGGGGGGCYLTGTPGRGGIGGGGNAGAPGPGSGAQVGFAGTANTGGGGGGGSYQPSRPGGAGGSGIVIIRYSLTPASAISTAQTRFNTSTGSLESYGTNNAFNTQSTGNNIEIQGLVLHVDGARYTSGSPIWPDLSGLGNDVTLLNGPTYSAANGGTLVFDGSNDYGTIPTFTGKPTVQITCEAWIYPTRAPSTGTIRGAVISSTNSMYHGIIDSQDSGLTHSLHVANQTTNSRTGSLVGKIPQNQWSHITMTYDGIRNRGYINGAIVYDVAQTGTIPDATYVIGTYGLGLTDGVHNFLGNIAVARIYSRALSTQEIQKNYNAEISRFTGLNLSVVTPPIVTGDLAIHLDAANPSSYADLQGFNTTWYDISGNGVNGTAVNGAVYTATTAPPSFAFDGINDKINFNYLVPGVARSFFIWVRYNSLTHPSGYQLMGTQQGGAFTYIGIENGGSIYYYAGDSTGGNIGNAVTAGVWFYLGFVLYPDGYRTVYRNGIPIHNNTGALGGAATNPFNIGTINDSYWLNGNVSAVHLYHRALTPAEVMQNFSAQRSQHGI